GPATPLSHTAKLDTVRVAIMECCSTLNLPFVDMRDVVNSSNRQLYTGADDVHPNDVGHVFGGCRQQCGCCSFM
ncbi:SGNH/GDSL hydrolase family protein, partial [Escherichia coli]